MVSFEQIPVVGSALWSGVEVAVGSEVYKILALMPHNLDSTHLGSPELGWVCEVVHM